MRTGYRILLFAAAAAVTSRAVSIEPADKTAPLDEMRLAEDVYALRPDLAVGNPSVIVVRDGREAVLIDAGMPDNGAALREWMKAHGIDRVRYLVLSHDHTDHVWGANALGADSPAVIATAQQAQRLSAGVLHGTNDRLDPRVRPTLLVESELSLRTATQTLRIVRPPHRRSHTNGDLFVFIQPADVLYAGDHLFAGRFPVIDRESGGDLWGYLANVEWLIEEMSDSTRWIAGHGSFAPEAWVSYSRAEVAEWVSRLRESIAEIAALKAQGLTLEAAQARGVGERFGDLGQRPRFVKPEAWIASVYAAIEDREKRHFYGRINPGPDCAASKAAID
jgi:glyoxylase-like metal-dependent hydrolase (beta-lactamase superfamily II)